MDELNKVITAATEVFEDGYSNARLFVCGGAVRDLAYGQLPIKDIDIFITGLPNDNVEAVKLLFAKVAAKLNNNSELEVAEIKNYLEETTDLASVMHSPAYTMLRYSPAGTISFDLVNGKETIEETVSAFDWYQCMWYLSDINSEYARRPDLAGMKILTDTPIKDFQDHNLLLVNYHHAAKTLMRGFKLMSRHGFAMSVTDAQLLTTECRLMEATYGRYLYAQRS